MASSEPLEKSSPSVSPLQTLFTALQSQDPQSVTRALDGLGSILAEGPEKSIRESIIAAVTGVFDRKGRSDPIGKQALLLIVAEGLEVGDSKAVLRKVFFTVPDPDLTQAIVTKLFDSAFPRDWRSALPFLRYALIDPALDAAKFAVIPFAKMYAEARQQYFNDERNKERDKNPEMKSFYLTLFSLLGEFHVKSVLAKLQACSSPRSMCAHAVRLLRSSRIPATVESLHRDVKKSGMDPLEYFITAFTEKNRIVVGMPCSSEGGLSLVLPFFETVISELQALGKHPRLLLPCPDTYESSLNDLDQGVVADFDLVGEALAMPDEPDEAFDRAVRARISDFLGRVRPKVKIVCYGSDFIKDRAPEDADVRNIVFTSIRTPGERKSVNQNVILITEAELTSFGMHSHWEAPLVVLPEKFPRTKSFALRVVSSSMTAQILDDIKIGAFDTLIYLRERTQ